jgi:tetratricopeptide (TPR) repeat protein
LKREFDEYGFPVPEGFDDEPKPRRRTPRIHPLVALPLVMLVVTGVASAVKYWPQWVEHAERFALALDRRSAALERAEHHIRRNPHDPQGYLLRGDEYLRRKKYPQAIRDYQRVLEAFPEDAAVRGRLAMALNNFAYERALAGEDLDEALADVDRALDLTPANAAFLDTRGYLYFLLGKYEEALPDLEQAVQLAEEELRTAHPRFAWWYREALAEILQHRAMLYDGLDRPEDAMRDRMRIRQL